MLLFAGIISVAFAFLSRQTTRERIRYAGLAFLAFVGVALAIGWVMYFFQR
jgi:uncharacterized membrane protein